ncbi:MAG: hypothetical protein WCF84_27030 [Anaerolineae bacterium]
MSPQGFFNWITFNSLLLFVVVEAVILWRKPSWWLPLFTLFLGIVVGWFDAKSSEVSFSVLLLLTLGLFAGFQQPKRAWLWALFLGAGVPAFAFLTFTLKVATPTPVELATSFLSLVFAFIGAYAGVVLRRFAPPTAASAASTDAFGKRING